MGMQMRANYGSEYQKFYKERFAGVVNGQFWRRAHSKNVQEWNEKARTSMFRTGLTQIKDDQDNDIYDDPVFDLNAIDE